MAKEVKKKLTKIKKKRWIQIVDAGAFGKAVLGETYVENPEQVMAKTINVNMMELTRDHKKQNVIITFEVGSLKNEKALANIVGYGLNASSIKRMMRRGKARIDISKIYKTKDGKMVKIKPFVVTRFSTFKSTLHSLRASIHKHLQEYLLTHDYESFVRDLVSNSLQKSLRLKLYKIMPLASCEIREMKLVTGKKNEEKVEKVEVKVKEVKTEEKVEKAKEEPKEGKAEE